MTAVTDRSPELVTTTEPGKWRGPAGPVIAEKKPLPLHGYIRVSTHLQADEGMGLEVQRDGITTWAAQLGHDVVSWSVDEETGKVGAEQRDGLAQALAAVQDGDVAGVVVLCLDRLARDLIVQEQLLAEFWRSGGEVFSTRPAEAAYVVRDDPADPSRKLIRQILGAIAEYERAVIRLRLEAGKRRKHANGGFAYGSPPYGWRAQDKELVPVPAEQAVIARIAELRGAGVGLLAVAEALNAEGHTTQRGGAWRSESVRRVVRRMAPAAS